MHLQIRYITPETLLEGYNLATKGQTRKLLTSAKDEGHSFLEGLHKDNHFTVLVILSSLPHKQANATHFVSKLLSIINVMPVT